MESVLKSGLAAQKAISNVIQPQIGNGSNLNQPRAAEAEVRVENLLQKIFSSLSRDAVEEIEDYAEGTERSFVKS